MTDFDINEFNALLVDEYFSLESCTLRIAEDWLTTDKSNPKFYAVAKFIRQLAILHHKCKIRFIAGKTSKEIFKTESSSSVSDCFCKMYQVPSEQLKTIECSTTIAGSCSVTCIFVIPQLRQNMSQHQVKWQEARIVAVNNKRLEVGYLADAVAILLEPIWYKNFSYFLNISIEGDSLSLTEAGLLFKCCQLVVDFCSKEMHRLWNFASDEDLEEQFSNFVASQKVSKKTHSGKSTKTVADMEAVQKELKCALMFAEGAYKWAITHEFSRNVMKEHEKDDEINPSYRKRIEELVDSFKHCKAVLDDMIKSESRKVKKTADKNDSIKESTASDDSVTLRAIKNNRRVSKQSVHNSPVVTVPETPITESDHMNTELDKALENLEKAQQAVKPVDSELVASLEQVKIISSLEYVETPRASHEMEPTLKRVLSFDDKELTKNIESPTKKSRKAKRAISCEPLTTTTTTSKSVEEVPKLNNKNSKDDTVVEVSDIDETPPRISYPQLILKKEKLAADVLEEYERSCGNGYFLNDAEPVKISQLQAKPPSPTILSPELFSDDSPAVEASQEPMKRGRGRPKKNSSKESDSDGLTSPKNHLSQSMTNVEKPKAAATVQETSKKKRDWLTEAARKCETPKQYPNSKKKEMLNKKRTIQSPIDGYVTRQKKANHQDSPMPSTSAFDRLKNESDIGVVRAKKAVAERRVKKDVEKDNKFAKLRETRERKHTANQGLYDMNSNVSDKDKPIEPSVIEIESDGEEDEVNAGDRELMKFDLLPPLNLGWDKD